MQKAVGEVRGQVAGREQEVRGLLAERERVRRERGVAHALLEVERRVGELEAGLVVGQGGGGGGAAKKENGTEAGSVESSDEDEDEEDEDSEDEDEGDTGGGISPARLRRLARQYLGVRQIVRKIGVEHPFLVAQEPRLTKIRNTLLLDLGAALKQAKAAGPQGKNRVLKVMSIYAEMDEGMEAVKVLKGGP
ncbi:hypothetical protein MPH_03771 [Macrophomina phaseolina MS6]|uniref:Uncharacterized protein n=1 Tax=Macrophomina phaseolina (strain MS6) TaxID=1126212 RepID=K2SQJ2_MACPH|nr:hypothetical protein MPH_03771 [Macrophomina phaseolina MS6]